MPSIFCHRLVQGKNYQKPFEKLIYRKESTEQLNGVKPHETTSREIIARRAALEFEDGMYGKTFKKF